jgi:hypothetical protein
VKVGGALRALADRIRKPLWIDAATAAETAALR